MTPDPSDRLKVEIFTNLYGSTPDDPYHDITNDSGDLSDNYSVLEPPDKETARRLVACWNVCRGISTEDLERSGLAAQGRHPSNSPFAMQKS